MVGRQRANRTFLVEHIRCASERLALYFDARAGRQSYQWSRSSLQLPRLRPRAPTRSQSGERIALCWTAAAAQGWPVGRAARGGWRARSSMYYRLVVLAIG